MNWSTHSLVLSPLAWHAVSGMSPGSRGAYMLLAIEQWVSGGPIPVLRVADVVGRPWAELPEALRVLFFKDAGTISISWVEEYRAKRMEFLARQAANGALGGRPPARKQRRRTAAKPAQAPAGELQWPPWATTKFKQAWEDWKAYKLEAHKFRFKWVRTEQAALRLFARHCVAEGQALWLMEEAMAGGWMAPVWDHAEKYKPKEQSTRWD